MDRAYFYAGRGIGGASCQATGPSFAALERKGIKESIKDKFLILLDRTLGHVAAVHTLFEPLALVRILQVSS